VATVGVLSFQGGFQRHIEVLRSLGVSVVGVRDLEGLETADALVIPGGESTTIGMLMERFGLLEAVTRRVAGGFPVYGSCAGAILLARRIESSDQPRIGAMDMTVRRNAYGRQVESFEADTRPTDAGTWTDGPFHGVFIRAPRIVHTGPDVTTLLVYEDHPVLVRSGAMLASTFHPELTGDDRIHRYFIEQVAAL
jgi:pyridoxal 5'-phosphate synthase pdxT subunit